MGFRAIVVVCATSFLIGALAVHWIADSLTLWQAPVTDAHLHTAAIYYSLLATMPSEMIYVFFACVSLGAMTLLLSFWDGRAGNLMFDGASIFLYGCAIVVYLWSVIPTLPRFANLPSDTSTLKVPTLELASAHLVCSVVLTGVLFLQGGRYWAEGEENDWKTDNEDETAFTKEGARGRGPRPAVTEDIQQRPKTPSVRRKDGRKRKVIPSKGETAL